jgi:hypothetical protein
MQLQILGPQGRYPRPQLVDPPPRGYLHLGAVVEPPPGRAPFTRTSPTKNALLERLKSLARQAESVEAVEKATVYKAVVVPPVVGYAKRPDVHPARYDVVALVETSSPDDIGKVQASEAYQALHDTLAGAARSDQHVMAARCVKSLGDVDKTRPGLFLFNYFVADDVDVALELWESLAAWYTVETGLDNSTLLQPIGPADYAFVNHARWDYGLGRFMLRQFTKPSFRTYVQANLLVNRTGSMPVMYHLA